MIARLPFLLMVLLPFSLPLAGCARFTFLSPLEHGSGFVRAEQFFGTVPDASGQAVLVIPGGGSSVLVHLFEKQEGAWSQAGQPIRAVAGRNGFAEPGEKREGDGKTPSGTFTLDEAFGYEPAVKTRMPYRQVALDDVWVDDAHSGDYNRWVKRAQTDARSFESLRRADDLYRYAVVIGYNTHPVSPGLGSAIFLHVWTGSDTPTAGCIAMAEEHLLDILAWLEPARHPVIVMNPRSR